MNFFISLNRASQAPPGKSARSLYTKIATAPAPVNTLVGAGA